jgi:hypothetical protein
MMNYRKIANVVCMAGVGLWLAGCAAQLQSTSSRIAAKPQKVDNLAVWSEVGNVVYVTGPTSPSKPFPETFRQSLAAALSAQGVAVTYKDVRNPGRMSTREIAQLRAQDSPNATARLLIEVKRVSTRPAAWVDVEQVVYHLTLSSVATNEPLWQAEIAVAHGMELPLWNESTAAQFANDIVALLKKDTFV